MRFVSLLAVMVLFWIINSGQLFNNFLLICLVVCTLGTTALGLVMGSFDRESNPLPYLVRSCGYGFWLGWQVLLSNIEVARLVWSPRMKLAPRFFTVPLGVKSGWAITTYANSITLTPGTVTVDVDPERDEMLIHALTASAKEGLESGDMLRRVQRIEGPR